MIYSSICSDAKIESLKYDLLYFQIEYQLFIFFKFSIKHSLNEIIQKNNSYNNADMIIFCNIANITIKIQTNRIHNMGERQDTREIILRGAFKLFLQKNYEKATIADIEQCIGMTRGAIFYHVKNKNELFMEVINTYILKTHDAKNKFKHKTDCSLKEFIGSYVEAVRETMAGIEALGIKNIHRAYFSLIYQAVQYYPDFDKQITRMFHQEYELWYEVVLRAYNTKEIRQDIVVESVARQFRYMYSGLSFEDSLKQGLDITALQQLYKNYYNQIKND